MLDYARELRVAGHDIDISYWSQASANVLDVISRVGQEFRLLHHSEATRVASEGSVI